MSITLPPVIHIVRRFGCVGGMESYVWNLTHELTKLGLQIGVICEETFGEFDPSIDIYKVPKSKPRPRWKAMQHFRHHVTRCVTDRLNKQLSLIHSHERSNCHHLTTFHGPPITDNKSFFSQLLVSRRVAAWKQMEKDELLSASTGQILAVSSIVKNQLLKLYPELAGKGISVAHPGIHPLPKIEHEPSQYTHPPKKFIFVGKEWKRKGLDLAIKILEQLPEQASIDVYGPTIGEVPNRLINQACINIMGWNERIPWEEYEVLIHPARKEPFGMVVAEARHHGVKVLTSTDVGSVELGFKDLVALETRAPITDWVQALESLTMNRSRVSECLWTWSDLARLYVDKFYPTAFNALKNE